MENRLKELRTKKHLTLKELGEQLGMPNNTLSQYETGKREPKLETWQKLADFFGVSVPYLQGIEPDFEKITERTKNIIVDVLQSAYFGNYAERLEKNAKELKKAISRYLSLKQVNKLPLDFYSSKEKGRALTPELTHYWLDHFDFLFSDDLGLSHQLRHKKYFIRNINRLDYNNRLKVTQGRIYRSAKDTIEEQIVNEFQTGLSKYFNYWFKSEEQKQHEKFLENLITIDTVEALNKNFLEYQNYLNNLYKKLKTDLDTGKIERWNNEEQRERKLFEKIIDDLNNFTSEEMDTIALNSIGINGLDRKQFLATIKALKEKRHEDTSLIDEYLEKYGEQN